MIDIYRTRISSNASTFCIKLLINSIFIIILRGERVIGESCPHTQTFEYSVLPNSFENCSHICLLNPILVVLSRSVYCKRSIQFV